MAKKAFIFLLLCGCAVNLSAQIIASGGAGGNYTIPNYPGNFTSYYDGFSVIFRSNHSSLGVSTMNIAGLGAKNIVNTAGAALSANDIRIDQVVTLIYDNTNNRFQMITASGNVGGGAIAGSGTLNYLAKFTPDGTTLGNSLIFDDGTNVGIGTNSPAELLELSSFTDADILMKTVANGDNSALFGYRARSGPAAVSSGDVLLGLRGLGYDGSAYQTGGAIEIISNGAAGANDMPGAIDFYTTPDGSAGVVNRMRIDNAGKVGIGTTSPFTKLHVVDNAQNGIVSQVSAAAAFPFYSLYRTRGSVGAESAVLSNDFLGNIIFMSHNGVSVGDAAYLLARATENHGVGRGTELQFHTTANGIGSPSLQMVISHNGNVGIGITAPGAKLEVAGQIKITGGTPGAGKVLTSDAAGLATWQSPVGGGVAGSGILNYIPKFTPDGTTLGSSNIFDDGTNVGIGTAIPGHKLDISGTGTVYGRIISTTVAAANEGGLLLSRGDMANGYAQSHYLTGATFHWSTGLRLGDSNFHFWNAADGADRMTIQAGTGYMGIGTSAPLLKMDARGLNAKTTTAFENIFQVGSTDAAGPLALRIGIQTHGTISSRFGAIEVDDAGIKRNLVLQPTGGNVGIGTTIPSAKFQVVQTAAQPAIFGTTNSTFGTGVAGEAAAATGNTKGISGYSNSSSGIGVYGWGNAGASSYGGYFEGRGYFSANVGLGVLPSATERLLVQGVTFDNTAAAFSAINQLGSSLLYVRNDGYVGIGTTAPAEKLTVFGNIRLTTTVGEVNRTTNGADKTGTSHLLPIGYAVSDRNGTAITKTPNITITKSGAGSYNVAFSDYGSFATTIPVAMVSIMDDGGESRSLINWTVLSGNTLLIKTFDLGGTSADRGFSITVFNP